MHVCRSTHRIIEQASMPAEGSQPLAFKSRFAHNFFEQVCTPHLSMQCLRKLQVASSSVQGSMR